MLCRDLEIRGVCALDDDYVYVADNTQGLVVINRQNPEQLAVRNRVLGSGGLQDVVLQ